MAVSVYSFHFKMLYLSLGGSIIKFIFICWFWSKQARFVLITCRITAFLVYDWADLNTQDKWKYLYTVFIWRCCVFTWGGRILSSVYFGLETSKRWIIISQYMHKSREKATQRDNCVDGHSEWLALKIDIFGRFYFLLNFVKLQPQSQNISPQGLYYPVMYTKTMILTTCKRKNFVKKQKTKQNILLQNAKQFHVKILARLFIA